MSIIYTDDCHPNIEKLIHYELGLDIVRQLNDSTWNINDAMAIITDPGLILAVINQLNEITLMEIALLHFMCKPILITHRAIEEYPILERCVDFIDYTCNLKDLNSNFITWFKWWETQ